MLLSTTLLFATSSLAIVIPDINTDNQPKTGFLPATIQTSSQTVNLDCSTCPFALESQRNGAHEWTNDVESELEMTVETDDKALKFNGVPFYPIANPILPPTLYVSQSKKDGQSSNMKGYDGNLRLSYSLEYDEKKLKDGSIVTVLMTVMGLDSQMINVDNIEITAIKDLDGKVSIVPHSQRPEANFLQIIGHSVKTVPVSPNSPDAKCETILCRVFTKVITGMAKAKASAHSAGHKMKCFCVKCFHKLTGHKNFHPQPHHHQESGKHGMPHRLPDGTMELPSHIHFKPQGQGHHHHHHQGFAHHMASVFRTTFKVVFVPILIGIAFGMAASAIGMLVGQAVVFLWMKYRGTSRKGAYEPLDTAEKEAPPAYQDVDQATETFNEKEVDAKT